MRRALALLMLCGLALRLFTSFDMHLHEWDERYHALVAKNLAAHPLTPTLYDDPVMPYDYRDWTGNHVWLHKQPLPLWMMAASIALFGANELAVRLPSIVLSTLGIAIMFFLGRRLFNRRIAFIAAFLYSIHGLIIELTAGRVATDHIDVFFLFFIQLGVYFAVEFAATKKALFNAVCGASIAAAILCKWLPALIVMPLWLIVVIESRRFSKKEILLHLLVLCAIVGALALPWQVWIQTRFPLEASWESNFNVRHITEPLDNLGGPLLYHFNKMRMVYGDALYLPMLWFLWRAFRRPRIGTRLLLAVWFVVPYIFFTVVQTKMQAYTLFVAPAFFLITALACHHALVYRWRWKRRVFASILLVLLIGSPARYSIERIKPFVLRDRNPAWCSELKERRHMFAGYRRAVLFNVSRPIETMFTTDAIAYSSIPDSAVVESLLRKGCTVFINDDGSIPQSVKGIGGIHLVSLPSNVPSR